ncbi:HAD-IIB family hydrolase [bacterium]|nr:HAD-IIB family hydrolase [bacterium]
MLEKDIKIIFEKKKDSKLLIFTDLDATLLDHHTYSFEPAKEAIELAKNMGIDIIFVTSKTRAETELYRKRMDIQKSFIVENGGALFVPKGQFEQEVIGEVLPIIDKMHLKIFGTPKKKLIQVMDEIKSISHLKIRCMSEMTIDEISEITFLSLKESELARMREFSEPFQIMGNFSKSDENVLFDLIRSKGLDVTRGGRFYHLMGDNDKGKAVIYLLKIYKKHFQRDILSIGIGDSRNDIPLFKSCDIPIAVQRPGREYNNELIEETHPYLSGGVGPSGWNKGIIKVLGFLKE